jgi:hypothetical protein
MKQDSLKIERTLIVFSARRLTNEAVNIVCRFFAGYLQAMNHPLQKQLKQEIFSKPLQDFLYYLFSRHAFDENGFIQMKTAEADIVLHMSADPDDQEDLSVSALPFAGMVVSEEPVQLIIQRNLNVVVGSDQITALEKMQLQGVLLLKDAQIKEVQTEKYLPQPARPGIISQLKKAIDALELRPDTVIESAGQILDTWQKQGVLLAPAIVFKNRNLRVIVGQFNPYRSEEVENIRNLLKELKEKEYSIGVFLLRKPREWQERLKEANYDEHFEDYWLGEDRKEDVARADFEYLQ